MTKQGESLGDCPECGEKDGVIYRGDNEAVCKKCGMVFEVELEDGDQEPEVDTSDGAGIDQLAAEAAEPEPAPHIPKPVEPVLPQGGTTEAPSAFDTPPVNTGTEPTVDQHAAGHEPPKVIVDGAVGKLNEVVGQNLRLTDKLELKQPAKKQEAADLKIPEYIQKSRPWRWAHEMGNTGNPYRHGTKSYEVFLIIAAGQTTVSQLIRNLYEQKPEVCDKLNILLTIYEVLTQCVAAGLLVMDQESGMVQVCQGPPQPHKMP